MGLEVFVGLAVLVALVGKALGATRRRRLVRRVAAAATRAGLWRSAPTRPEGRPIELISRDVQRLGRRFRHPPPKMSFARYEGLRRAYDKVLAEACQAMSVDHLLGVLTPGPELDNERDRVERVLYLAGLRVDEAA